jgi:hypothetical protein
MNINYINIFLSIIMMFIYNDFQMLQISADDDKNAHLRSLEGASDRLVLLQADLLDPESLRTAFAGCEGVFHTASPVTDDPVCFYIF